MERLRIENPCPFLLIKMKKDGQNYFCPSCSKTVIDFREKNVEELKSSISADICGIFNSDQLPGQKRMTIFRKMMFSYLTVLSFLGFSVKPFSIQAQAKPDNDTTIVKKESEKGIEISDSTVVKPNQNRKTKEKRLFRRKKKQTYRINGCPAF